MQYLFDVYQSARRRCSCCDSSRTALSSPPPPQHHNRTDLTECREKRGTVRGTAQRLQRSRPSRAYVAVERRCCFTTHPCHHLEETGAALLLSRHTALFLPCVPFLRIFFAGRHRAAFETIFHRSKDTELHTGQADSREFNIVCMGVAFYRELFPTPCRSAQKINSFFERWQAENSRQLENVQSFV